MESQAGWRKHRKPLPPGKKMSRIFPDGLSAANGLKKKKKEQDKIQPCPSHWMQRHSRAEQTTGFWEAVGKFQGVPVWLNQKKKRGSNPPTKAILAQLSPHFGSRRPGCSLYGNPTTIPVIP